MINFANVIFSLWQNPDLQNSAQQVLEKKFKADLQVFQGNLELIGHLLFEPWLNGKSSQRTDADVLSYLQQAIQLNLQHQSVSADLNLALLKQLSALLQSNLQQTSSSSGKEMVTIALTGCVGETIQTALQIQNHWNVPLTSALQITPFTLPGAETIVKPPIQFDPPQFTLQPHQTQVVTLIMPIAPEFKIDRTYTAMLTATGMDTIQVQVCLQVQDR